MDDADAKRLVDFAAGLIFGLRGGMERVTQKVFLLSPANVDVTAEDKARIARAASSTRADRSGSGFVGTHRYGSDASDGRGASMNVVGAVLSWVSVDLLPVPGVPRRDGVGFAVRPAPGSRAVSCWSSWRRRSRSQTPR